MSERLIIRTARKEDAAALLEIYAPYVRETAISFEYEVPSVPEFEKRILETLLRYPYLVAEAETAEGLEEGSGCNAEGASGMKGAAGTKTRRILGYAYAGAFHARPAYDWAVETSIYVDQSRRHAGVGRRLYEALEAALSRMGVLNLNACIAVPSEDAEKEDAHLDKNSMEYHAHMGYCLVGRFTKCGYKFGRWYDMVWMEKLIGTHLKEQPPVRAYRDIPDAAKNAPH